MRTREGYWIHEWDEECSSLTPGAHWKSEYHAVTVRMWIPNSITDDDSVDAYIEQHCDDLDAYVHDDMPLLRVRRPREGFVIDPDGIERPEMTPGFRRMLDFMKHRSKFHAHQKPFWSYLWGRIKSFVGR